MAIAHRHNALLVATAFLVLALATASSEHTATTRDATAAFFDRYVAADGRVVRVGEHDDTVSEGQAYALLLAVRAGDEPTFRLVWRWTETHLRRRDGLFSWYWNNGRVRDPSPATDADLDIAHALLEAGRTFHDGDLIDAGERTARAVLVHESVMLGSDLVIVPGPWAVARRIVGPGYLDVCTFGDLARLTGDARWREAQRGATNVLRALLVDTKLPPDWVSADAAGRLHPTGPPDDPAAPPQYGLDAVRVALRLARCHEGTDIAAALWPALRDLRADGGAEAYTLDGRQITPSKNAAGLLAASSAAAAASETTASGQLRDEATALNRAAPTYYGSAWLALTS